MVQFSRVRLATSPMCHPQIIRSRQQMRHDGGHTLQYQDHREGFRALPLKAMECEQLDNASELAHTARVPAGALYPVITYELADQVLRAVRWATELLPPQGCMTTLPGHPNLNKIVLTYVW